MSNWLSGNVILNDYLIERELGRGGMGRVWLVKSNSTGRRFAAKQALIRDDKHRKAFLAELQTWIDLPEHPNIVPCRFFRTVGDEIVIFADYVDGGSLADWIAKRKLTSLEKILDVAIQFAWGLHAIHERGLIHQDVKPGNVLMTADGVPMVTDFGLARARLRAADGSFISPALPPGAQSVLVSSGGMTPAYASPEQRAGQPISRKTDIWSWGVSVLDMFMGGVSCPHGGQIAADVLEDFLRTEGDRDLPRMPRTIAEVMRRCFREDPGERWADIAKVAEALQQAYQYGSGKAYARQSPAPMQEEQRGIATDRTVKEGVTWSNPREWLRKAKEAEGSAIEGTTEVPQSHRSRRAQALADLAIYQEAGRIYERLIARGREKHKDDLATLRFEQALIHHYLDDVPGCLACYEKTISILEDLVRRAGDWTLVGPLALSYKNKANALIDQGDLTSAAGAYDKCITLLERLVGRQDWRHLNDDLATAYMNKAIALKMMCNLPEAACLYDKCIATLERLVLEDERADLAFDLSSAYLNKANIVGDMGDLPGAMWLHDKCIAIRELMVETGGQEDSADSLARAYMNKAVTLTDSGDPGAAAQLLDKCIAIRERLVKREGRRDLTDDLAMTYQNKAGAVGDLGDNCGAVALYDRAIEVYERLVNLEGRRDLAGNLAWAQLRRADCIVKIGSMSGSERESAQKAFASLLREAQRTGRSDLMRVEKWAREALKDVI